MTSEQAIRDYQQRSCYERYSADVGLPKDYRYSTGNPIRPVPAVQTSCGRVMIIGAYPSARFESRQSPKTGRRRLIPIADNLQPFGTEEYFDGTRVRRLESAAGLKKYLLDPLELTLENCWVTDLVKVFLYKPTHVDSCADAVPGFNAPMLREQFGNLAKRSLKWIKDECELCCPQAVITLGEEVAQAVTGEILTADELLSARARQPASMNGISTFCCPHPDICRRSDKWRNRIAVIVKAIKEQLK